MLRIRTVTTTNGETLNAYEQAEQQSCGWADAANVRQPQLLVVMVATQDRQMGIYPGPALVGTLTDPVWLAIVVPSHPRRHLVACRRRCSGGTGGRGHAGCGMTEPVGGSRDERNRMIDGLFVATQTVGPSGHPRPAPTC